MKLSKLELEKVFNLKLYVVFFWLIWQVFYYAVHLMCIFYYHFKTLHIYLIYNCYSLNFPIVFSYFFSIHWILPIPKPFSKLTSMYLFKLFRLCKVPRNDWLQRPSLHNTICIYDVCLSLSLSLYSVATIDRPSKEAAKWAKVLPQFEVLSDSQRAATFRLPREGGEGDKHNGRR